MTFIAPYATKIVKVIVKEIIQDPEDPDMLIITTSNKSIRIPKNQLFPLCDNYNDAADQISRLGRGIKVTKNLENEVGT